MSDLKLIFFKGCPRVNDFRKALQEAGYKDFDEVEQTSLPSNHPMKGYVSPTILFKNHIIIGHKTGDLSGGCSIEHPCSEEIKKRIGTPQSPLGRISGFIGSFGSGITIGLCPVCYPAIGAFLSSIGLGVIVQEAILKPLLLLFLIIAIGGIAWSYLKIHRNPLPLILGIVFAVGMYVGRYVFMNLFVMYISIAGIIIISIWNMLLSKRQTTSQSCKSVH